MNSKESLISVIIPVYNRTTLLRRAIKSVLCQTYQFFEILVIDDFSEKDIVSVIDKIGDKRVHYYRLPEKGNGNIARNYGMKIAQGDFIAFLDSDDEYLPGHLQRRIEKIKEWNCDGIYGSAFINDGESELVRFTSEMPQGMNLVDFFLNNCFSSTNSFFLKSESIKNIFWDERLKCFQDEDFIIRVAQKCTLRADFKPTTRIYWLKSDAPRLFTYEECELFYSKYRSEISDQEFAIHYFGMYQSFKANNSKVAFKFRRECRKLSIYFTFHQYILLFPKETRIRMYILWLRFILDNFFNILKSHIN